MTGVAVVVGAAGVSGDVGAGSPVQPAREAVSTAPSASSLSPRTAIAIPPVWLLLMLRQSSCRIGWLRREAR